MKKLVGLLLACMALYLAFELVSPHPGAPATIGAASASYTPAAHQHTSSAGDAITGPPTISAGFINDLLCRQGSPACGTGQQFIADGLRYGIDPVWVLAIFWHESNFGRAGEARASLSIGNLRCLDQQHYGDLAPACRDGYAWFASWQAGIEACYRLLASPLYVAGGLRSIEQIIPRWAPASDGNAPARYISVVRAAVALWRAGKEQVPA